MLLQRRYSTNGGSFVLGRFKSFNFLRLRRHLNKIFVLTLISLVLIFSTMISGRSITASRQALSCTSWPLCPNGFMFPGPKFFSENVHRLLAIMAAITVSLTTTISILNKSKFKKIAVIALSCIVAEIIIGMFVVYTNLQALLVATHLSNGVVIFALTILLLAAYKKPKPPNVP
jgi:heme A synthase